MSLDIPDNDDVRRDRPLTFHFSLPHDIAALIGLPDVECELTERARNAFLADLLIAARCGQWVSYSRDKALWADASFYGGTAFNMQTVFWCVEHFLANGLAEEERARPGDHMRTQRQSRIRATPRLIDLVNERLGGLDLAYAYDPLEVIRLKDAEKRLIRYEDSRRIIAMRRDVHEQNEAWTSTQIILDAPDIEWVGRLVEVDGALVLPSRVRAHRVFNTQWNLGGRWYGTFWQALSKRRRAQIRINDQPVAEKDYSNLHIRMLYEEQGLDLDGDAYDVKVPHAALDLIRLAGMTPRDAVKRATNAYINARPRRQAILAVAGILATVPEAEDEPRAEGAVAEKKRPPLKPEHLKASADLLEAIDARHPDPVCRAGFGSGAGRRLQRLDSDMMANVQRRARNEGVVMLSVHDSGLATEGRDFDRMADIMDDERARLRASLTGKTVTWNGQADTISAPPGVSKTGIVTGKHFALPANNLGSFGLTYGPCPPGFGVVGLPVGLLPACFASLAVLSVSGPVRSDVGPAPAAEFVSGPAAGPVVPATSGRVDALHEDRSPAVVPSAGSAIPATADGVAERKRVRDVEAKRLKRREAGVKARAEGERRTKPWLALGVSRRTYYRRRTQNARGTNTAPYTQDWAEEAPEPQHDAAATETTTASNGQAETARGTPRETISAPNTAALAARTAGTRPDVEVERDGRACQLGGCATSDHEPEDRLARLRTLWWPWVPVAQQPDTVPSIPPDERKRILDKLLARRAA
jgi:hypothetical protein